MNVIDRVTTGRCSLDFFRGGSKVKVNIGKFDFWISSLKRSRPQDVVALANEQNGKFNFARMTYVAHITNPLTLQISKRYIHVE